MGPVVMPQATNPEADMLSYRIARQTSDGLVYAVLNHIDMVSVTWTLCPSECDVFYVKCTAQAIAKKFPKAFVVTSGTKDVVKRDPMASALGTRDHMIKASSDPIVVEMARLKKAIDRLDASIMSKPRGPQRAGLIKLMADRVARFQTLAQQWAEGHDFPKR